MSHACICTGLCGRVSTRPEPSLGSAMKPCLTPADWLRSLDGLHPSDITQWISMSPNSSIAQLYRQGTFYSGYFVKQAPGDEFPGVLGPLTGPKTLHTDHGHGRHSVLVTCSPGYGGPDAVTCAPEAESNTYASAPSLPPQLRLRQTSSLAFRDQGAAKLRRGADAVCYVGGTYTARQLHP